MENMMMISAQEAAMAAGGFAQQDNVHDLSNYVYRTVCNLPAGTFLQMQRKPNGAFMRQMYGNGEAIFVHRTFWQDGYYLAFRNGVYGFVDALYVR